MVLTALTSIHDLIPGPVGFGLLLSAVVLLVYWRTRSMHAIWSRIWTILISKRHHGDTPVERFHEEQMQMLKFRFFTNIPVRTLRQVNAVIEWMGRHDQDPSVVVACGPFFDVRIPGLTPNAHAFNKKWAKVPMVMGCVFICMAVVGASLMSLDRALLKFNATQNWFFLDEAYANRFGNKQGLAFKRCGSAHSDLVKDSGFELAEVSMLCKAFRDDEVHAFVQKSVEEQRMVLGCLTAFLLVLALICTSAAGQVAAMLTLRETLSARPQAETETTPVA